MEAISSLHRWWWVCASREGRAKMDHTNEHMKNFCRISPFISFTCTKFLSKQFDFSRQTMQEFGLKKVLDMREVDVLRLQMTCKETVTMVCNRMRFWWKKTENRNVATRRTKGFCFRSTAEIQFSLDKNEF